MVVVSGTSLLGGVTIPAGTTFTIVIDPDTALEEIVDATAVSTNTFTITRAIDGSSAQAHSAGAVVRHMAIGRDYREANTHIEASTGVHGISNSSSVVGTIDTQTLTNKTLTAPTITNPNISGAGVDASIVFEGATPDAYETTLTVVDPTQNNTITMPNTTGTVVIATAVQTLTNKTLTSPTISGSPVITGLSSAGMSASSATPKDYVDSILGSATAAATSAASAAASATAAATSATSAAASATAAAASAVTAGSSATAAATSATSAAASATAAATSATSAAASATAAATSATSASASATASATSATASATSATASATSASAAATSASSAATSASSAATSATSSALSYTTFNDQYLGSKSTAPTLNNSGGALASGNLYFNTTDSTLYVYNVSAWQAAAVSTAGFATTGTNAFTAAQTITVASGTAVPLTIQNNGTGDSFVVNDVASDTTPFTITAAGNVGIGTATPAQILSIYSPTGATIISEGDSTTFNILSRSSSDTTSAAVVFRKARGTSASRTTITTGDFLANIIGAGYDGTNNTIAGSIVIGSEGTVSTGVVPGTLIFNTANSSGTLTERMRIDSAGRIGIGSGTAAGQLLRLNANATGGTTAYGVNNIQTIQSDVTTTYAAFRTNVITQASAFTLLELSHFTANQQTLGASSAITNQYGFVASSTLIGASLNYGFFGDIASSGSSRWNFYANGTAPNYFAGRTGIGGALASGAMAGVFNTTAADVGFIVRGAASQTGDLLQIQNSASTVLFEVDSSGNVGIGTTALTTFANYGSITLNGVDGTIWSAKVNGTETFRIQPTGSATVLNQTANTPLTFNTNNTERMRISNTGNVFIGTNVTVGQNTGGLTIQGKDIELMQIMGAY
jgi:hypothetical protein